MCCARGSTAAIARPTGHPIQAGTLATQRKIIHIMSSEYSPSGSRRPSRRGGRGPRRSNRTSTQQSPQKPAPKQSLFAKILGFLTGKSAEAPAPAHRPQAPVAETPSNGSASSRGSRERQPRAERPTGMRSPEMVEVSSPRLYVGNLSFDASESDLFDLFNGVGSVQNVEVVVNRQTMRSKGFAFVQMHSIVEAKRAVD
jgi:RNA recognition motif-containing protein